jgi:hypothetical protein
VNDPTATHVIWESVEYFRRKNSAISVHIFPECAKRLDAPVTVYVRRINCLWRSVFDRLYILQVINVGLYNRILVIVSGLQEFSSSLYVSATTAIPSTKALVPLLSIPAGISAY